MFRLFGHVVENPKVNVPKLELVDKLFPNQNKSQTKRANLTKVDFNKDIKCYLKLGHFLCNQYFLHLQIVNN